MSLGLEFAIFEARSRNAFYPYKNAFSQLAIGQIWIWAFSGLEFAIFEARSRNAFYLYKNALSQLATSQIGIWAFSEPRGKDFATRPGNFLERL